MCIIMSEAVTVPCLTMMTLIISEQSLVRDTHTGTGVVYSIFTHDHQTFSYLTAAVHFVGQLDF